MEANIQEIYTTAIHPLTSEEKLRIATLILEEVTGQSRGNGVGESAGRPGDITRFFGAWKGGSPDGSDNEMIDADLARALAGEIEEQN
ncbi:MAG: hypothetical protein ACKV2V_07235 [Blastocatellia bacterium]